MLRKTWFGGVFKPKNLHSLEHLRYLYSVLSKNQTVSESNRGLLVETLRSIAEILIWGDQNDSSVFDFFLEKNMLEFFLRIMRQKCGSYVCVQLLQTLNILFENIKNETSIYYLLSNNHVNSIIVHKFDFSDEEVMAYYISFVKTLSFKLNSHTIHFFYNEHTNDFPLYTEGIKFFNHPESMVRIAVRTLTLNVYRVNDQSMLKFIRDKTAAPYFSNLVWFIGNHILEIDSCVRDDYDHDSRDKLSGLVAEHLDHLHYLNDILRLHITPLNHLLAHHLLHRLLLPLLVHSLLPPNALEDEQEQIVQVSTIDSSEGQSSENELVGDVTRSRRRKRRTSPRVSKVVSLFSLSQVFLILSFPPLVTTLARTLIHASTALLKHYSSEKNNQTKTAFIAPEESLEKSLITHGVSTPKRVVTKSDEDQLNITDEEKQQLLGYQLPSGCVVTSSITNADLPSRPFLESVLESLECRENDYTSLFSLCLLFALDHNEGFTEKAFEEDVAEPSSNKEKVAPLPLSRDKYNTLLVERMLHVISLGTRYNSKVRVVTLEMAILVLKRAVGINTKKAPENTTTNNTENSEVTSVSDTKVDSDTNDTAKNDNDVTDTIKVNSDTKDSTKVDSDTTKVDNDTTDTIKVNSDTNDSTKLDRDTSDTIELDSANIDNTSSDKSTIVKDSDNIKSEVINSDIETEDIKDRCGISSEHAIDDKKVDLNSCDKCSNSLEECKCSDVKGTEDEKVEINEDKTKLEEENASSCSASVKDSASVDVSVRPKSGEDSTLTVDETTRRRRPLSGNKAFLSDEHLALLEGVREEATLVLRNFYKSEEMFLDLFEDEWSHSGCDKVVSSTNEVLRVEYLLQDSNMLLPPTATPLTGIALNKRRPCGEVERARRAMRVFFIVRSVCFTMRGETDHQLPLTKPSSCVKVEEVLDLNNSDLIACVVITRDGEQRTRRFLVIDVLQLILVEPDQRRLGWGVAKFVGFLQDLEVSGDKDDSRILHITLHKPAASTSTVSRNSRLAPTPLLAAKFIFDDHIRCMAAKQRLCKGRNKARQRKLHQIARLLELPEHMHPCPSPPSHPLSAMRQEARRQGSRSNARGASRYRGPGRATSQHTSHQQRGVRSGSGHRLGGVEEIQLEPMRSNLRRT